MSYLTDIIDEINDEVINEFNKKDSFFLKYDNITNYYRNVYISQIEHVANKAMNGETCEYYYYNYNKNAYYCLKVVEDDTSYLKFLRKNNINVYKTIDLTDLVNRSTNNKKEEIVALSERWVLKEITHNNIKSDFKNKYEHFLMSTHKRWLKLLFSHKCYEWCIVDKTYNVVRKSNYKKSNDEFNNYETARAYYEKLIQESYKEDWIDEMVSGRSTHGCKIEKYGSVVSLHGRDVCFIDEMLSSAFNDTYRGISYGAEYYHAYTEIAHRFYDVVINTSTVTRYRIGYRK